MSLSPGPGFERLLKRLVRRLAARLTNGEFTERGLARILGISQPHLHHILAGKRSLTPQVADGILASLDWSLGELFSGEELMQIVLHHQSQAGIHGLIPVASGHLGPDFPFPEFSRVQEWLPIRTPWTARLRRPFLVELGPDPAFPFSFPGKRFALVALDENLRLDLSPRGWYVVQWGGAGFVRRLRREKDALVLLGQGALAAPAGPEAIPLSGRSPLALVQARLLWAGPDPRKFDPFSQSGCTFPPADLP